MELHSCDRNHIVHQANYIYCLALHRKSGQMPALKNKRGESPSGGDDVATDGSKLPFGVFLPLCLHHLVLCLTLVHGGGEEKF